MQTTLERYWQQFLAWLPPDASRPERYYEAFCFGTTAQAANSIPLLVIAGVKTSTGSLKWVYDVEGKPLPKPGDYSIVTDWNGEPVCIIETVEVRIVPFEEVDAQFAYEGGEGDRTLASWKEGYWKYLCQECVRIGKEPSVTIPMVCERFRAIYKDGLHKPPAMPHIRKKPISPE